MVILLTSVVQYHHHDCVGNIFLCLTGNETELAIGYAPHGLEPCDHTDHDDHCPSTHHHHGSTASCSLHLNDVIETKSLLQSTSCSIDSEATFSNFPAAVLPSYPLLSQVVTPILSLVQGIAANDIPDINSTGPVSRRGPPCIA